ncbi:MAG: ABC transporter ATP-binding protein [Azoarcus sp.]|jgi:iron complex transport system ATP-binding protein|nr:ABC transporter ATP-binding protein [Azoarcus sp.]
MTISVLPSELACPLPWPDPARPLLAARRLALRRGARELCREFDLEVHAGQCVAILGRNGAGKTTLLHALAGLHDVGKGAAALDVRGEICFGDRSCADWPPVQAARFRGLLPQRQPMPFAASVQETVLVGRHPHLGRWGWESAADVSIASAALDCVGLQGFASRDLRALSGGEQQRVALAMLLAQTPRLFLLDEPLNHLDLHHQIAVLELFRALAACGRGVVMALHDLALAARYADIIIMLDGEGGVELGTSGDVLTARSLSRAFGHPLRRIEVDGQAVFLPE